MGPGAQHDTGISNLRRSERTLSHSVAVSLDRGVALCFGELLSLGPTRARIRTNGTLRRGARVVLTLSVPEHTTERTQAMFRIRSQVDGAATEPDGLNQYVLHFAVDETNLDRVDELVARLRTRGILEG